MKTTETGLQKHVIDELRWEPSLDSSRIGVYVEHGVVALSGHVRSLLERQLAEQAVKRVRGVTAVANEVQVELLPDARRDDVSIARAAKDALLWNVQVPEQALQVTVSHGWVTLEGEVPFQYQKAAAKDAVSRLAGVLGVADRVRIRPSMTAKDVKRRLNAALHRQANLEAEGIEVDASGTEVVLRGRVSSWNERDRVQDAAWSIPGVTAVDNLLAVQP